MRQFVTVDGDNVGQSITACYLRNDAKALTEINGLVAAKTREIADFLRLLGFSVLFCAADGVTAVSESSDATDEVLFAGIVKIAGEQLTFSAGVGATLRESYVALLSAKSNGKARLHNYRDMAPDV
jgi:hypothetical protein